MVKYKWRGQVYNMRPAASLYKYSTGQTPYRIALLYRDSDNKLRISTRFFTRSFLIINLSDTDEHRIKMDFLKLIKEVSND